MHRLEDLNEIATRFCGAILFDGEGNSAVVEAKQCFSFDALESAGVEGVTVKFSEIILDKEAFSLDDLPTNVISREEVKTNILNELDRLPKNIQAEIINELRINNKLVSSFINMSLYWKNKGQITLSKRALDYVLAAGKLNATKQ